MWFQSAGAAGEILARVGMGSCSNLAELEFEREKLQHVTQRETPGQPASVDHQQSAVAGSLHLHHRVDGISVARYGIARRAGFHDLADGQPIPAFPVPSERPEPK